jgi:hypothetical protein
MFMDRPSYKEINSKIKKAKEAVSDNQFSILNPFIIAADALELGVNLERISSILVDLLEEIAPTHYVGQHPPQRSYKQDIKGCELLAFRWLSEKLGCSVYLKFTMKGNKMWLVSLHEDR